jgi:hypothetical protein
MAPDIVLDVTRERCGERSQCAITRAPGRRCSHECLLDPPQKIEVRPVLLVERMAHLAAKIHPVPPIVVIGYHNTKRRQDSLDPDQPADD